MRRRAIPLLLLAALSYAQTQAPNPTPGNAPAPPPIQAPLTVGQLKQEAEKGDAGAQFELGVRYHEGRGVSQSYVEALRWFLMAANQNLPDAEFNVGVMYEKGRGVQPDYQEAGLWYRKAAALEYAPALYNLGVMYDKARGVALDYGQAMQWYRKAAVQNYAPALYNIGLLYYYGQGIPQNYVQAYLWVSLAINAPPDDPQKPISADQQKFSEMRKQIAAKMTPEQIAEGDRLAAAGVPPLSAEPAPNPASNVLSPQFPGTHSLPTPSH
jgi:hypothetical protein